MPSYKDLLRLLRKGKTPREIISFLEMRPSRWRKMIEGKRFKDTLGTEEQLSAIMAAHDIAAGVHDAAERFAELLTCDKPETVRKVALALLPEGLAAAACQRNQDAPAGPARLSAWSTTDQVELPDWPDDDEADEEAQE